MAELFDVSRLPGAAQLVAEFEQTALTDPAAQALKRVYQTGVMFDVDGRRAEINESCMFLTEAAVLWHVIRQHRSPLVVETGFGRGTSAAVFLAAMAPWKGRLVSIDPAFRHWAEDTGIVYIRELGLSEQHDLREEPSEIALPRLIQDGPKKLSFAYVDGSHQFDGTLIDFVYLDRIMQVGGVIGIDDAQAPAVRTVASFVANNLPYHLHYATPRLVLCQKTAETNRGWEHFKPFTSSTRSDWNPHTDRPTPQEVPNATFGYS